jgi:hypothetical protein
LIFGDSIFVEKMFEWSQLGTQSCGEAALHGTQLRWISIGVIKLT